MFEKFFGWMGEKLVATVDALDGIMDSSASEEMDDVEIVFSKLPAEADSFESLSNYDGL